jgi:hypothetical protein
VSALADATAALTFVWVGLVVGISFLEAPLKFRAPGVTIPLGLGIGRLVFRALNRLELLLAVLIIIGAIMGLPNRVVPVVFAGVALVVLLAQVAVVRPRLNRRSDAVLAGGSYAKRSHTHLYYVALEPVKLATLIALGVALFS